jgi:ATP-dependent Clp protease ATP-binding subunit ClpA
MQAEPPKTDPPKRKRRWFQFSLRTVWFEGAGLIRLRFPWSLRRCTKARMKLVAPVTAASLQLSTDAAIVIDMAIAEAYRSQVGYVGTEHLLLGLIDEGRSSAAGALAHLGIDAQSVRSERGKLDPSKSEIVRFSRLFRTPTLKRALKLAIEEANCTNEKAVRPEHFLLGLLNSDENWASLILKNLGVTTVVARGLIQQLQGRGGPSQAESS